MPQRIWLTLGFALMLVATSMGSRAFAVQVRLDHSFGKDGIARTPLPPAYDTEGFDEVAIVANGGVLTRIGGFFSIGIDHFGPDGALVGEETSKELTSLRPPSAIAANGDRLVGVGPEYAQEGAVSRYLPDGSLDPTFGSGGISESLPFDVEAVAALPSGEVLAAGEGLYESGGTKGAPVNQAFVARLGAEGKLDPGFGQGGFVKLRSEDKIFDPKIFHVQARTDGGAELVTRFSVVALDASGNLDRSFGEGGSVATRGEAVGAEATAGEAVLVAGTRRREPDRKEGSAGPEEFYVARYTAGGELDRSYAGGSGVAVLAPEGGAQAGSALFEPDGSVLIGGLVKPRSPDCPHGYACDRAPAVVRFTPDGKPDAGFGQGGIVLLSPLVVRIGSPSYLYGVDALAARPGGGFFAAGEAEHAAFVAAIAANGSMIESFGAGGIAAKSSPETAQATPEATGVDGSGDLFVVAETNSGTSLAQRDAVLRYSPDGKLDQKFGEEGVAFVPPGAQSLAVAPDGTTYVTSASESTLTKVTATGALDPSFGIYGSVVFPFPKHHYAPWAVVRLTDGDLVVAGDLTSKHGTRLTVLRYLPDGKLDRSYGKGGSEVVNRGQARRLGVTTMNVDRQGRILIAGSGPRHLRGRSTPAGMLIRLTANGSLDRSFGKDGSALVGGGSPTVIEGLAVRGDHILGVASSYRRNSRIDLLCSFGSDGRLDRHFGDLGVAPPMLAPTRTRKHEVEGPVAVFSTPRRILVVRAGVVPPLVPFSPQGHRESSLLLHVGGLTPRRRTYGIPATPVATLDGGNLVFAWSGSPIHPADRGLPAEVNLQRLLLR